MSGVVISGIIICVIVMIFVIVMVGGITGPSSAYDKLVANGIPGRGILLRVAPRSSGQITTSSGYVYQQRMVTIDVEIPGQPPYEVSASPYVPMNVVRDVLPGATVEIRVDKNDPANIAIVGPGVAFATPLALLEQTTTSSSQTRSSQS